MMTNLRLRNTYNEDGGAWINANTGQLAYARKLLADLRVDEPEAGWRLETRGTATQWHQMDAPFAACTVYGADISPRVTTRELWAKCLLHAVGADPLTSPTV